MGLFNWEKVTDQAEWQARDSAGEFVFMDHMWILGGWFSPQTPNPRDVWKSADGKHWTRVVETAPWEHSDLSAVMVFRDKMWVMGGRKLPGAANSNKVWSSTDGAQWVLETESAAWSPRVSSSFAVFKDRMWILGGTENFYDHSDAMVKNDVWSSADGRTWDLVTPNAAWPKRAHAQAIVFDNKLWIMGGGLWHPQHAARNDVWCSEDGEHWTQVTPAAAWKPRLWFSTVVYRDRMWLLGGWSKENGNFADVWVSDDGANWTEIKCGVIWKARHEHSSFVFQDRIWVAGGHADPVNSEVWSLWAPPDWPGAR
ncbi:MAG TPA: galactose oxidase [Candidatus Brocadiia bacterium]|nr:galactose oxidase [Candidatus Brocadiia bacterium]